MKIEFLDIANKHEFYTKDQISLVNNDDEREYRVIPISLYKINDPDEFENLLVKLKDSELGMYFIDDYDLGIFLEANGYFQNILIKHMQKYESFEDKNLLEEAQNEYEFLINISDRF